MGKLRVKYFSEEDSDSWETFRKKYPLPTFYHRIEWWRIIKDCFNHDLFYLMAMEDNQVRGLLPLVLIKSRLFGSILVSMPFLNYGGILADNREARLLLLDEAGKILKQNDADYLELRQLESNQTDLPVKLHKVSMTVELNKDPEVLWNNFKSKHRSAIRRAQKSNLTFVKGGIELLDPFYDLICRGWRDLGTPIYSKDFFRNILLQLKDSIEISVIYHDDIPIATAFDGIDGNTVEGMWTYALQEYRHLYTNYLLYWELLKRACLEGYEYFHLGRSTADTGATFFKNKWNAIPKQLYWEYILNRSSEMPELNVDNPKYKLSINIWRHLPVKLTQIIGPHISKNIP
jgi:FemAB-related protein (PEP-CTERM system-associated)